ncbi:hypothetical protein ACWDV4_27710 [Micromonospora sp. NPDC003197]
MMSNSEMSRIRRQMRRRIRDVVAERRLARQHDAAAAETANPAPIAADPRLGEGAMISS